MGALDPRREPAWRRYLRFWGTDPARDLDDELEFHLTALYDQYVAEGMSPADARAESRRRFGNLSRVRDECVTIDSQWTRERSVSDKMQQLVSELRHALHQLRRNPSLSVAAIICLALGIGANTAIFSVVNAVLYRPLDFRDPDQLVLVGEGLPRFSDTNLGVISLPEVTDYARLDGRIFARSAAYEPADYAISAAGADPERVTALRASTTLLEVLGVNPARGRSFLASDADTASESVAIISDVLWRRLFAGNANVVGQRIDIEGRPTTIIGVMPPSFQFPLPGAGGQPADVIVPLRLTPAMRALRANTYDTWLVARLANGVSRVSAQRAVAEIAENLPRLHPDSYPSDWKTLAEIFPLRGYAVKDVRRPLLILLSAVALVLLIACINVSSLLLARAAAREQEIAVRQALGASFPRLVQQFLAESLVLVLIGGTVGVFMASLLVGVLVAHAPREVLHGYTVSIDMRVLGLTALVTVATAIAFSLVPVLGYRDSAGKSLRDTTRTTAGAARQRARRAMVVTQIALALLLTTGAGLMIRSFLRARDADPGFNPERLVTFRTGLPKARYADRASILQVEQRLIDGLHELPGVRAVSATSNLPLGDPFRIAFAVEGVVLPKVPIALDEMVYPDYFEAMGIRLKEGRGFTASDRQGSLPVVVVNDRLARQFFGDASAVGKRIKWGAPGSPNPWLTIVGVAANVKQLGIDQSADAAIYMPALQLDTNIVPAALRGPAFVVRTDGDPRAVIAAVPRIMRGIDPTIPIVALQPMTNVVSSSLASRSFNTTLLAMFALLALVLASVGVYGLIAYSVVQRTREIGVRLAIGAMPAEIVGSVVKEGLRLAGTGAIIGMVGSLLLTRAMRSLLFDVSPFDATSLIVSVAVLFVCAVAAAYNPARRASRIDPQVALRAE